ncbi:MAG: DUF4147 domain-containing protein [Acidobacteria bacterium]|nr:DUF4147 domain-containing protein [Acidobacteriota bacterium]
MTGYKQLARQIFAEALAAVDVRAAVQREVLADDETITIADTLISRADIDCIFIIAIGKAAMPMYQAAAQSLNGIDHKAVVIAPEETRAEVRGAFFAGTHPLPTEQSFAAARAVLELLHTANERTAVLFLISGGASAMMELPLDSAITVEETAAFHQALIASGLRIAEMNALRKHFSAVKGGRLALAAVNARAQYTLLISDVPSATPDAIASGPSLPDSTTIDDCRKLLSPLQLPPSVQRFFEDPQLPETPKANNAAFVRATWKVILSSDHLAQAAAQAAQRASFTPVIDNTCDEWEYRKAGEYLFQRAGDLLQQQGKYCLISVGEVSVELPRNPGTGGRNQQFALWCAKQLQLLPNTPLTVLSAGSDGIDGNSTAAGAVADGDTLQNALDHGLWPRKNYADFDANPLFTTLGDVIVTGPTGNNLRDLRLILIDSAPAG